MTPQLSTPSPPTTEHLGLGHVQGRERFGLTWGPGGGHRQRKRQALIRGLASIRDLLTLAWACRRAELKAAATPDKTEPRTWPGRPDIASGSAEFIVNTALPTTKRRIPAPSEGSILCGVATPISSPAVRAPALTAYSPDGRRRGPTPNRTAPTTTSAALAHRLPGREQFGLTWSPDAGHRQKKRQALIGDLTSVRNLLTLPWASRRAELKAATPGKTEPRAWPGRLDIASGSAEFIVNTALPTTERRVRLPSEGSILCGVAAPISSPAVRAPALTAYSPDGRRRGPTPNRIAVSTTRAAPTHRLPGRERSGSTWSPDGDHRRCEGSILGGGASAPTTARAGNERAAIRYFLEVAA
jgi:hypothetical protein